MNRLTKKKNVQYWTLQILIIVGIIYLSTKISFLFEPIGIFFSTLFFPIMISGFLYFLLNPFVGYLQKLKLPRILAILVIYVIILGVIGLIVGKRKCSFSAYFRKKIRYTSSNHYYSYSLCWKFSRNTRNDTCHSSLCCIKNNHLEFCQFLRLRKSTIEKEIKSLNQKTPFRLLKVAFIRFIIVLDFSINYFV